MYKQGGKSRVHPAILEYRRKNELCHTCGAGGHVSTNCPGYPRLDRSCVKVVDKDFDIYAGQKPLNVIVSAISPQRFIKCEIYLPGNNIPLRQQVLIDTGAHESYIDSDIAAHLQLKRRKIKEPYYPIGADGRHLPRVTKQAVLRFGFGSHVEIRWLDIMPLGGLGMVLGRNWLCLHDPIIRASAGFYPVFDRDWCRNCRAIDGDRIRDDVRITNDPRAVSEVSFTSHIVIHRDNVTTVNVTDGCIRDALPYDIRVTTCHSDSPDRSKNTSPPLFAEVSDQSGSSTPKTTTPITTWIPPRNVEETTPQPEVGHISVNEINWLH
jgi:hypothetical protein